jgi:hypothetical protein
MRSRVISLASILSLFDGALVVQVQGDLFGLLGFDHMLDQHGPGRHDCGVARSEFLQLLTLIASSGFVRVTNHDSLIGAPTDDLQSPAGTSQTQGQCGSSKCDAVIKRSR